MLFLKRTRIEVETRKKIHRHKNQLNHPNISNQQLVLDENSMETIDKQNLYLYLIGVLPVPIKYHSSLGRERIASSLLNSNKPGRNINGKPIHNKYYYEVFKSHTRIIYIHAIVILSIRFDCRRFLLVYHIV